MSTKRTLLTFIGTIALCLLIPVQGRAEYTLKMYKAAKDTDPFKSYIYGVGVGFVVANAHLKDQGDKLLYCQPVKLALDVDNYIQLLDTYLETHKQFKEESSVEILLLLALRDAFPCQPPSKPGGSTK